MPDDYPKYEEQCGRIRQENAKLLDDLKTQIKEGMPEWLATLARHDDPEIDDPDEIWGF
jgi:hypothetical protein